MTIVDDVYASSLLNCKVKDMHGKKIGIVKDIFFNSNGTYPVVTVFKIDNVCYAAKDFMMQGSSFVGKCGFKELTPAQLTENDFSIRKMLLDKQIVDTAGYKVVRVNDVKMASVNSEIILVGVDIGFKGLLRRLGLFTGLTKNLADNLVTWNYIEPISIDYDKIQLNVSHKKLNSLHPADIADILDDLSIAERKHILDNLDDETVAEALGEADVDTQVEIFENIDSERASHILEEMAPDEAADILSKLTEEKSSELLNLMEPEDADDVRGLMEYDEDTAGALMTTEFICFTETITADQTIHRLRELAPDAEIIYYLFVVNESEQLVGVVSLRELIIAKPETPLAEIMSTRVIKIRDIEDTDKVKNIIAKYNLLALPVVNENDVMLGIITVDDVLDLLLPDRSSLESFAYRIRG